MRKFTIFLLLLTVTTSFGCTGSFNLTRKVYDAHRSQPDKWSDELVFLVVAFLPIYSIATLGDAIIFNSIEFWTGDNPVVYNPNGETKFVSKEGDTLVMSYDEGTDEITVKVTKKDGQSETLLLSRTGEAVVAKDENGTPLYSSVKDANGNLTVYDGQIQMVKNMSAGQFEDLKKQLLK